MTNEYSDRLATGEDVLTVTSQAATELVSIEEEVKRLGERAKGLRGFLGLTLPGPLVVAGYRVGLQAGYTLYRWDSDMLEQAVAELPDGDPLRYRLAQARKVSISYDGKQVEGVYQQVDPNSLVAATMFEARKAVVVEPTVKIERVK